MTKHEMAVNIRLDKASNKGILVVDDRIFDNWEDVVPILKGSLERDRKLRIVVRGDAAVPAGEIQRAMNLIGEAGIADIAFASSNK
jgi:biopolymer transport protein ExbD